MNWIVNFVMWALGLFLNKTPPQVVVAKEAGAAEANLKTVETFDAQVQKASTARDAAGRFVSSPAKLCVVERTDPNNLDNG